MFDLEKAISEWKKALRRSPSIDDGDLAELEREKGQWLKVHSALTALWKPAAEER